MKPFSALGLAFFLGVSVTSFGLSGPIVPALAAEDVSFDNVSTTFEGGSLSIPHIDIRGSSLSKAELESAMNSPLGLPTADALSKFDASSVNIPEIRLEFTAPITGNGASPSETITYSDTRIEDLKSGKAARASIAATTAEIRGPSSFNSSFGKILVSDYDLAGLVRFVFAAAQPGETPKQISGSSTAENGHFTYPNGVEVNIAHMSVGAVKARPLVTPLAELIPVLKPMMLPDKKLAPAAAAKMMSMLADFYDAVAIDGVSASDITIKVPDPSFDNASIQTLKIGQLANSRIAEWSIDGLEVKAEGGHVKLGHAALLGLDLKPFLSSLSALTKNGEFNDDAAKNYDWRNGIPHLDAIEVSNVDFDIPRGANPESFKVAGYDIRLGNYVGSIPTSLQSRLDRFAADTSSLKDQGAELQQLGYKKIDLSTGTDLAWNETSKSLNINEISAKGVDMGSVLLKATLGNVPRELFSGSLAQMQVAGLGVTLGEASLRLDNTGLLDKIIERAAAAQKTTPDKLRALWGTQAALGIPQMFGGSDGAKALGSAVASFIAKPKNLSVSVKSKNANGLGLTDLMTGGGPNAAAILDKLDVKAIANQ
ncbi:MAG: hypothetical protein JOZ88_12720 [Hyphomicrobiales bacterium]|nr:hypothetical protein [Hyphomicrobiales bacterium]